MIDIRYFLHSSPHKPLEMDLDPATAKGGAPPIEGDQDCIDLDKLVFSTPEDYIYYNVSPSFCIVLTQVLSDLILPYSIIFLLMKDGDIPTV